MLLLPFLFYTVKKNITEALKCIMMMMVMIFILLVQTVCITVDVVPQCR